MEKPSRWTPIRATITDRSTAAAATRYGVLGAGLCAFCAWAESLAFVHHPIYAVDEFSILNVALCGIIAWRISRHSLVASVLGLLLFVTEQVTGYALYPSVRGGWLLGFFLGVSFFSNSIRATWFLRTHPKAPSEPTTFISRSLNTPDAG